MEKCNDKKCPHHGGLRLRGRSFTGTIIAARMQNTATVEWERRRHVPKYERHLKLRTKIKVHNPPCIDAKKGDIVKITECRPLSKTKHFAIVSKLGEEALFAEREASMEEAKVKKKPKKETEEAAHESN